MKIKVTATFVGQDENGEYNEIKQIYLIPSPNFCDAEKAVIALINDNEDPKKDTTIVTAMARYNVDQVIYNSNNASEIFDDKEDLFFEIVLQLTDNNNNKPKKVKHKMLVESKDMDTAKVEAILGNNISRSMFNDEKIISIKEVEIYKSLI